MRNEFTAVIEREDDWYIGYCPEIPGANGQGRTVEECRGSLADAISLILEDRREGGVVVEMPDQPILAIKPLAPQEDDGLTDELLAANPKFQELVARSKRSARKPFAAGEQELIKG
jgi:predicted RNase H-like HicB family nuclease